MVKAKEKRRQARHWAAVLELADHQCVYCGVKEELTRDHLKPRFEGGRSVKGNLVPACQPCNNAKADHPWRKWMKETGRYYRTEAVLVFLDKLWSRWPLDGEDFDRKFH